MRKGMAWAAALLALPAPIAAQGQKMPPLPPPSPPARRPRRRKMPLHGYRSKKRFAWRCNTITLCRRHAQRFCRIRPRRRPRISDRIRRYPGTRNFSRSSTPASSARDYLENQAQFDVGIGYTFRARQEAAAPVASGARPNRSDAALRWTTASGS